MFIRFPKKLKIRSMAFRAMLLNYDHFTSQCPGYVDPKMPEDLEMGKIRV